MSPLEPLWGPSTRAVHGAHRPSAPGEPVVGPLVLSATFLTDPGGAEPVRYTRYGNNPTQERVAAHVAQLEGAEAAVLTASGMGALAAALLACLEPGATVLAPPILYGGTHALLESFLAPWGVRVQRFDPHDPAAGDVWPVDVAVVLFEALSNPLVRVADLPRLAAAAHERGARVIVDATFATPINLQPLIHGADLVVHSATKYLGGHSDLTGGVVAGAAPLMAAVAERVRTLGWAMDPFTAWLLERGLKTLALRVERINANAHVLAEALQSHPAVARVHYPGLADHPDHAIARQLLHGFGGIVGIELRGGAAAADTFVRALRLALVAPSLGGVETLVSEPRRTSHAHLCADDRARLGVPDGFVRLSVGIEDVEDLQRDFTAALDAAAAVADVR